VTTSHWRAVARPLIAAALERTKGQDEKVIRAELHAAYPFGERANHPYKIWRDEIRRQRGTHAARAAKAARQAATGAIGDLFTPPDPPCCDCGTTTAERSPCPLCGKVYCQPCAEKPYEFCCDGHRVP
jgi:hypothetical protein